MILTLILDLNVTHLNCISVGLLMHTSRAQSLPPSQTPISAGNHANHRAQASCRQPRHSRRSQIPDHTHLLSLSSGRERGKQHSCPITTAFVWPVCPQAQEQWYNPAMSVRLALAPLRLCKRVCVCVCVWRDWWEIGRL